MPVNAAPVNQGKRLKESSVDIVFLNDLNPLLAEDGEKLENLLATTYEDGEVEIRPHCQCKFIVSNKRIGELCENCNTRAQSPFEQFESNLWLRSLYEDIPFINVDYWERLRQLIDKRYDVLRWIGDTTYRKIDQNSPEKILTVIDRISQIEGFERTYPWLVLNMEKIIKLLMNTAMFKDKRLEFEILLRLYKSMLSYEIPIISGRYFIKEYVKKTMIVTFTLSGLKKPINVFVNTSAKLNMGIHKERELSIAMTQTISMLSDFYIGQIKSTLGKKPGIFRKNLYGTRSHFSGRAVIVPISGRHDIDEVHLPYAIGLTIYEPMVRGVLFKRGYNYKQMKKKMTEGILNFDKELYDILMKLIHDSPTKGLHVLLNRNPTQKQGSIHHLRITKFHPNITDETMASSILIYKSLNADNDGDALNIKELEDRKMIELFMTLHPMNTMNGDAEPFVSGPNFSLSGAVPNLSMYLAKEIDFEGSYDNIPDELLL